MHTKTLVVKTTGGVEIKVSVRKLCELAMLADWQLVELGYDPRSITAAALDLGD